MALNCGGCKINGTVFGSFDFSPVSGQRMASRCFVKQTVSLSNNLSLNQYLPGLIFKLRCSFQKIFGEINIMADIHRVEILAGESYLVHLVTGRLNLERGISLWYKHN